MRFSTTYLVIEINGRIFRDVGVHDRVVVQEVIKQMAQTHQLNEKAQKEFKGANFDQFHKH